VGADARATRARASGRPSSTGKPLSWRALSAMLAATLLTAALAGCGSGSSGTSASPATVTPAGVPLYIDAVVRPEGSLKANATTAATELTGRQHPFEGLLKLLGGPSDKTPNYAKEVEPWLGPHAGVFLSGIELSAVQGLLSGETLSKVLSEGLSGLEAALLGHGGLQAALSASSAQGALVLDTSNVSKAKEFLEGQAHAAGSHTVTYRGVTFLLSPTGVAEGIVHRFAVIGSEAGVKSVIETAAGGPALAQASGYSKLLSSAEGGALANAYLNSEALARALGGGGESILPLLLGLLGNPGQLYVSAIPSASSIALNLDTLPASATSGSGASGSDSAGSAGQQGGPAIGESGAQVLRGLPGSAWLAIGVGDLGTALERGSHSLGALAALGSAVKVGGIDFGAILAPLSSRSLNVERDLLSWMGATGVYVSGSSILSLQGAVIVTSKDPARSRAAVAELGAAYREAGAAVAPTTVPGTETAVTVKLSGFPLTLTLAAGQGKFVAGLGSPSIEEALNPQTTLGSSPAYTAAASSLGHGIQPSALIEFHTLLGLLESLGLNQAPGFSGFTSAIAPLGSVTVGGGKSLEGGVTRARVVIGLQQQ
jgi:Protein of unknown function (DUF3352)